MTKPEDVKEMIESVGGEVEEMVVLPDGHGFATASFPLPADHWLTAEGDNVPPMPWRCGTDHPRHRELVEQIRAAGRYAARCATMNGSEMDFDPDALCQNLVVGLLGYHTPDGLSGDGWANPDPVPERLPGVGGV